MGTLNDMVEDLKKENKTLKEQLDAYKKALELACEQIAYCSGEPWWADDELIKLDETIWTGYEDRKKKLMDYFVEKAKYKESEKLS